MSAELDAALARMLANGDAETMDLLTSLAPLPCPMEEKRRLWRASSALGREWQARYWQPALSLWDNLQALGVTRVDAMSPIDAMAYRARALYDPNTMSIALDMARLDELAALFGGEGGGLLGREDIQLRLLAHEVFHHIEETREQPLDARLAARLDRPVPPPLRDVGAAAFVNACFAGPPCQWMDILWMRRYAPVRLAEAWQALGPAP